MQQKKKKKKKKNGDKTVKAKTKFIKGYLFCTCSWEGGDLCYLPANFRIFYYLSLFLKIFFK